MHLKQKEYPVCWIDNPFDLLTVETTSVVQGITVQEWLDKNGGLDRLNQRPTVCVYRGRELMRADYQKVRIHDGVCFVTIPQGGGGDDGGSDPVRIAITIAIVALAVWAGPAAFGAGTFMAGATTAAIIAVGGIALNAMMPLPGAPESTNQAIKQSQASPTYSLGAQGNSARLGAVIPVLYGTMRIYPDFAALPYARYEGNEQHLYQYFSLGQGEHDVSDIRFDDTSVDSYAEVQYEIIQPGNAATLFPTEVVSVAEAGGQSLNDTSTVGPYVVNTEDTRIDKIEMDIIFPGGLVHVSQSDGSEHDLSVHLRIIAAKWNGTGWNDDITLIDETVTRRTRTPQRLTFVKDVDVGRYRLSVQRVTGATDSYSPSAMQLAAVRGFYVDDGKNPYSGLTTLAVKAKATDSLNNNAAQKLNVLATRKLPVHTGSAWTVPQPTCNPVWAFVDIIKSSYGGKFDDSVLQLAELKAQADLYDERNDEFCGRFDTASNVWEALVKVAQTGRAMPVREGNKIRLVRDQQETIPVAMFSGANIKQGSFSMEYAMHNERTAKKVRVLYSDKTWNYKQQSILCNTPGVEGETKEVTFFGITDRDQAYREGMYLVATNQLRRQFVSWDTGMEGYIPTYGDVVLVNHPLIDAAMYSGTVVNVEDDILTLSRDVDFSQHNEQWYLCVRNAEGEPSQTVTVEADAEPNKIRLLEPLPEGVIIEVDPNNAPSQFAIGTMNNWNRRVKITGIMPVDDHTVSIAGVVEDDAVHNAYALTSGEANQSDGSSSGKLPDAIPIAVIDPVTVTVSTSILGDGWFEVSVIWKEVPGAEYTLRRQFYDGAPIHYLKKLDKSYLTTWGQHVLDGKFRLIIDMEVNGTVSQKKLLIDATKTGSYTNPVDVPLPFSV